MDHESTRTFVNRVWDESIVPKLVEYIRIPNKSPDFDPDWEKNGYMTEAVDLIAAWCKTQMSAIEGLEISVESLPGRTPLIYMDIPASDGKHTEDCVLLYGHLDKQPEMTGWDEDLGPWKPVIKDDKLYGRGGADDGYAAFASLTAIAALQAQKIPHGRCVVLIEGSEESGSPDLPYYIDALADRIGKPSLVVCLDSGCGNYDQLWCTTSLRGMVVGTLTVELIREGVHSGDASGVVPDSFRVARKLLSRLEDQDTGEIFPECLKVDIPADRRAQAEVAAEVLNNEVFSKFPFHEGVSAVSDDLVELVLGRTWKAALSITGAEGLPAPSNAGNVCRPKTALVVSLRLPPTLQPQQAYQDVKRILTEDPPYNAKVSFEGDGMPGWNAPPMVPWLEEAIDKASETYFGRRSVAMGEGGSIPFMGMLGEKFPEAQFMITGVLGPASNAHGPNEFLHIPMGKSLTCCVASVVADHLNRNP